MIDFINAVCLITAPCQFDAFIWLVIIDPQYITSETFKQLFYFSEFLLS